MRGYKRDVISISFSNYQPLIELIDKDGILQISDKVVHGDLNWKHFSKVELKGVKITNCVFEGKVNFSSKSFISNVNIDTTIFKKTVDFISAEFLQKTFMKSCKFVSGVAFDDAIFIHGVNFESTRFFGSTSFRNAIFKNGLILNNVKFGEERDSYSINLRYDMINGEVRSENVTTVDFENCKFYCETYFYKTDFYQNVSFYNSSFKYSFLCDDMKFWGIVNFGNVDFADFFELQKVLFRNVVSFVEVNFIGNVTLSGVEFMDKVNFSKSMFESEVNFFNSEFNSDSFFIDTQFNHKTNFSFLIFSKNLNFKKSKFCLETTFKRVDFEAEVNFSNAVFKKGIEFAELKIKDDIYFTEAEFMKIVKFKSVVFYTTCMFNISDKSDFMLDMDTTKFNGIIYCSWDQMNKAISNNKLGVQHTKKRDMYQILKQNFNKLGQHDDEDAAFVKYQHHKYLARDKWISKLPACLDFIGGYGTKPLRVFRFFVIVFFAFTLMYFIPSIFGIHLLSQNSGEVDLVSSQWWKAMYFSGITMLTIGYGDISPNNAVSSIMAIMQGFMGITLASYLVVAIVRKTLR